MAEPVKEGWPGARLEEALRTLRGLGAAVGCVAVAVELQDDACPALDDALHTLAMDQARLGEEALEDLLKERREAKGTAELPAAGRGSCGRVEG